MSAVLAGLDEDEGFDSRACTRYLGTSAGSIVAASLIAGIAPGSRLGELPEQPAITSAQGAESDIPARILGGAVAVGSAAAPLASLALSSTAGGGALLRRTALRRVPDGRRSLAALRRAIELSGAGWDGRLRIAAVDRDSGSRVIFGAPGAPALSVAMAVEASCAIPGLFRPVRSGGRTYVDGGVWSPTNMDAIDVTARQSVLCLNPTGSLRPGRGALAGAFGPVSRGVAATEALALKHRGASVTTINPDASSVAVIGGNLMDAGRRDDAVAAGLEQGRKLAATQRNRAA